MTQLFPYTYISCTCSDELGKLTLPSRASRDIELENETQEEEEKTFDPRQPRSNFSLFPPEHLLYCEECHDIKCPRCITEEVICWYCPGCLFEVPSSSVKSDDNRCSRNCFSCPVCTSQLITTSVGDRSTGPYILSCTYCMWSSLDVGLQFESPNHLRSKIDSGGIGGIKKKQARVAPTEPGIDRLRRNFSKLAPGSSPLQAIQDLTRGEEEDTDAKDKRAADIDPKSRTEPNAQFAALRTFYKEQIGLVSGTGPVVGLDSFSSPSALTRIINLYNNSPSGKRPSKPQSLTMREALTSNEGLVFQSDLDVQPEPIPDYMDAVSPEQQAFQYPRSVGSPDAQHVSQLWPMSMKLRTKRSKRCTECKHILVKPEFKVTSTRYRIKLVAVNYIPMISLKPVPVSGGLKAPGPDGTDVVLEAGKASQWIMKLTNPLFENVNVSLGSPSVTPGRHGHKVTILCPQFSIGKNGDVWEDALGSQSSGLTKAVSNTDGAGEQIAGKIYESGRNWTSVVVEVIPSAIVKNEGEELGEDEDVIEIPIQVRLEWTVTDEDAERSKKKSEKALDDGGEADSGKRELAYWMVIGIGRVAT